MGIPGDEDLERWIQSFRGPLVGLLASWGSDWRGAEELAQDVFAEAWLGRERFRARPDDLVALGAWLRGIAWNLHCSARRAAARSPAPLETVDPISRTGESDTRRELLVEAFGRLEPQHQAVLRMQYLEESTTREVAALLGITPKAAEGRAYQARRALRELVERMEEVEQGART